MFPGSSTDKPASQKKQADGKCLRFEVQEIQESQQDHSHPLNSYMAARRLHLLLSESCSGANKPPAWLTLLRREFRGTFDAASEQLRVVFRAWKVLMCSEEKLYKCSYCVWMMQDIRPGELNQDNNKHFHPIHRCISCDYYFCASEMMQTRMKGELRCGLNKWHLHELDEPWPPQPLHNGTLVTARICRYCLRHFCLSRLHKYGKAEHSKYHIDLLARMSAYKLLRQWDCAQLIPLVHQLYKLSANFMTTPEWLEFEFEEIGMCQQFHNNVCYDRFNFRIYRDYEQ